MKSVIFVYLKNKDLGYAKTQIAITTLCELELVSENNGVLAAVNVSRKTDLLNSKTYKSIYERVNENE